MDLPLNLIGSPAQRRPAPARQDSAVARSAILSEAGTGKSERMLSTAAAAPEPTRNPRGPCWTGGWPHLVNALEIEDWSRRLDSRGQFPGVVRMLINRNNDQITRLDMRDAEGTGAHGYDGIVEALRGSTLVPVGRSVWEMGVNEDANAKANQDYNERTKNPQGENQVETTFVFVTPQRWDGKDKWAKKREAVWSVEGRSGHRRQQPDAGPGRGPGCSRAIQRDARQASHERAEHRVLVGTVLNHDLPTDFTADRARWTS